MFFMIHTIHNKSSHPAFMWNDDQRNLFLHWDVSTYENIFLWQNCINKRCSGDDQVSSFWSQSFFYKSATFKLCEQVDSKNMDQSAHYEGGLTSLFL